MPFSQSTTLDPSSMGNAFLTEKPMYNRLLSEHDNDVPDSAQQQEEFLIQDIEAARAEIADLENRRKTLFKLQAEAASRKCDQDSANEFCKLQRIWRREPVFGRDMLGSNWHGAALLAGLWAAILRVLNAADAPVALDEARELLMAEGFSDKIQQQTPESWWIMARCLAMHPEPEIAIREWIRRSRASDKLVETRRAMNAYAEAPNAEKSRCDLLKLAHEREAYWLARSNELKQEHQTRRELYSTGLQADRQITSSIKTLQGFLKHERSRLLGLEKELRQARENRARLEERARQKAVKAASRQSRQKSCTPQKKKVSQNGEPFEIGENQIETGFMAKNHGSSIPNGSQQAATSSIKPSPVDLGEKVSKSSAAITSNCETRPLPNSTDLVIQTLLAGWTDEELTQKPAHEKFMEVFLRLPRPDWHLMKQFIKLEIDRRSSEKTYLMTG